MKFQSYNPDYTGQNYPTGYGAYGEGRSSSYAKGFQPGVAPATRPAGGGNATQARNAMLHAAHTTSDQLRRRTGGGIYTGPGGQRNVGTRTVQRIEFDPEAVMPQMEVPTFEAPEFNERAVRAKAQKVAAPEIRRLRDVIQQAASRNYENPNVRSMTLRQALAGYGQGLEDVMASSQQTAHAQEMQEYQTEYGESLQNWQAKVNAAQQAYQNAFQKYLASAPRVSESRDLIEKY